MFCDFSLDTESFGTYGGSPGHDVGATCVAGAVNVAGLAERERADLIERLAELHPTFVRLPGGNYLEGDTLRDWYNWKQTVGPLMDRPGASGAVELQVDGWLGTAGVSQVGENLKIEPALAMYAGYSLRQQHANPGKEPNVKSTLDDVE